MPSECGLAPALLAGIGDARIRQRMEACQQGILQLDSLRQKHHKLMEVLFYFLILVIFNFQQLKSQYPDFASLPHRPTTNNEVSSFKTHKKLILFFKFPSYYLSVNFTTDLSNKNRIPDLFSSKIQTLIFETFS